jgi:SAM-dependent methyltransferase
MEPEKTKSLVRERYGEIAAAGSSCCGGSSPTVVSTASAHEIGDKIGYSKDEMESVPDGSNLGLGCGNPTALASIVEGETVLDLGSGAGFDSFLAARQVGASGKVIGVDMTPQMIAKARENAAKNGYENVEFRLGEIENLPVESGSVDIVISNCVINLAPDKGKVFREAHRSLKPGGRFYISDIVLLKELPASVKKSVEAYIGCVAGAILKQDYLDAIREAGFVDVKVVGESSVAVDSWLNDPFARSLIKTLGLGDEQAKDIAASVVSIKLEGRKKPQSEN